LAWVYSWSRDHENQRLTTNSLHINASRTLLLGLIIWMSVTSSCNTPDPSSGEHWFSSQRWEHRLLIFTEGDPGATRQRGLLEGEGGRLLDRNLLVIEVGQDETRLVNSGVFDLPGPVAFRERFELPSDVFEVVLVGKDGGVKERRSEALNPGELWAIIDAMPMRIDEMRRNQN